MSVNRIQLNSKTITGDTISIKLPIGQKISQVGQSDAIESEYVKVEVEKTINPIVDFERVRFSPTDSDNNPMKSVVFEIHTTSGDTYLENGYTADDFKFRRNNLKMSFLNLDFFDYNKPTKSNFLFNTSSYIQLKEPNPQSAVTQNISIKLENPITTPSGFSEGYYVYFDKKEVIDDDVDLYIIFKFNNAKTGATSKMMTTSSILTSAVEVVGYLYTKITLRKTGDKYVYFFDDTTNVDYTPDSVKVKLYETEIII